MRKTFGSGLFLSLLLLLCTYPPCRATTICEVQDYDPSTGLSWLEGQTVTVTGVVTVPPGFFVPDYTSIYIRGLDDDVCGENFFQFDPIPGGLNLGDTITVSGVVEEYILSGGEGSTTEIFGSGSGVLEVIRGDTLYVEPLVMRTGSVGTEDNEGKLVRVTGTVVGRDGSRQITLNDNSGSIDVFDQARSFETDPTWRNLSMGDVVTVTGVVAQAGPGPPYLTGYSIWPRSPEPPYEDVKTPACIPDTVIAQATLEITDLDGNRVSLFCPECPGGTNKVIINYNAPNTWRTQVRVYDAYGRDVATLRDFVTLCGEAEIEWTGRNELMERLPVGLYHVVVTAIDPGSGEVSHEVVPLVIGKRLR